MGFEPKTSYFTIFFQIQGEVPFELKLISNLGVKYFKEACTFVLTLACLKELCEVLHMSFYAACSYAPRHTLITVTRILCALLFVRNIFSPIYPNEFVQPWLSHEGFLKGERVGQVCAWKNNKLDCKIQVEWTWLVLLVSILILNFIIWTNVSSHFVLLFFPLLGGISSIYIFSLFLYCPC